RITPNKILFPKSPPMELYVRRKETGLMDRSSISGIVEGYSWSCLPGYLLKTEGYVAANFYLDDKCYSFFLLARPNKPDDEVDTNPCYGIISFVPMDFRVGATGHGSIHYDGFKVRSLMRRMLALKDEGPYVLGMDWVLLDAH